MEILYILLGIFLFLLLMLIYLNIEVNKEIFTGEITISDKIVKISLCIILLWSLFLFVLLLYGIYYISL